MSDQFVNWNEVKGREVMPGDLVWAVTGERLQVIRSEMAPGATFQIHSHPHEQIIVVLEGELQFTVAGVERIIGQGGAIHIPPDVAHGGRVHGDRRVVTLEAFHPVRRDFGHGSDQMTLESPR